MTARWVIETKEEEVFPVTNMFDRFGNPIETTHLAATIVVKLGPGEWWSTEVKAPVHTVQ